MNPKESSILFVVTMFSLFSGVAVAAGQIGTIDPVDGDISVRGHGATSTFSDSPRAYIEGSRIDVLSATAANLELGQKDGIVNIGPNTGAVVTSEPGYLVEADGDRIDFAFKYGEPFAVKMDCYVVRPHPLQNVDSRDVVAGSIIRDEQGLYVMGRNGRLDVTIDGSYVANEHRRRSLKSYGSVALPDRLHIVERFERLDGCGDGAGSVGSVPLSCPGS